MTDRPLRGVPVVLLACALAGCAKQQSTMGRPPEVNPRPPVEASAARRVDSLSELSERFSETTAKLPGRGADDFRTLAAESFAHLSQILPLLIGPDPNGSQRQQLRIIEGARGQLATAGQGLSPDPTIDTALRAARDALESVGRNSFYDKAEVGQTLDRLGGVVNTLDAARGFAHQQAVAQSFDLMSRAVSQMAGALNERLEEKQNGGQQPSTAPARQSPAVSLAF